MSRNPNSTGGCPVDHGGSSSQKSASNECPMSAGSDLLDPSNQMPVVPEQSRSPSQTAILSTTRTVSSIPRASRYAASPSECPALDNNTNTNADDDDRWVYPSEQMFFNAMKRKNWSPTEADMQTVVPIHNAVNERCWRHILEWEKMHESECVGGPRLLRFEGKAKDLTPKARIRG
ncbi:Cytochrome c1 heme lyase, partial [Coemansia aciculifera]